MDESVKEVALITGAGSGFGLLSAVELARRGLKVFGSLRDLGRAERLDRAAKEAGVTVEKVQLDVTRPDSIARALAEVGRVDVLINNAGFGLGGFLEDLTMDELREQLETNFFGLVAVTKAFLPGMRERRHGRIINVSSVGGRFATPGLSAYCASKWAVEGLSESLRHELRPLGVWVSLVEPGTFKTDIFDRNARRAAKMSDPASPWFARSQQMEKVVGALLDRSTADPADVARTIAHVATCAHPKLRYLVGKDARGQTLAKALLPFSMIEKAIDRYVGVKKE
ncbi:MAG TPA: SDR family NAD(P)-dependent oxidoreductase [Polyangia bacterium]|jgi:NAD(P)-dependent dehydrogenase (short-subunit alcohol dehydrogenase family)